MDIDGVTGKNIPIFVVPDEAQSVDLLVGRTFTELPYVTYARLGGCLRFWHKSQCPFSYLEPLSDDPKLIVKTTERSTLQANVINWITLSSESDVTGPVLFNNCGKEILLDMKDGEIAVPVFPSGNNDVVIKKRQRLGRVTAVDFVKTPGEKDNQRNRAEGSYETEKQGVFTTAIRKPIDKDQVEVGVSHVDARALKARLAGVGRDADRVTALGETKLLKKTMR
ncbi:hypothetical protein HPB47_009073 [Ixodes persulcatus]|uniref:Uncharacterized protein n=1 Tax=Ixodes persulcatus TaxID=34615 RepID=A0AC60P313_IXOPE|nr:hypothetical protein HPB47_009073 [Ixodes persulcatus]